MFWIDGSTIWMSDMGGRNGTVLVTSSQGGLVSPTKLAVDMSSLRLYWLDAAASRVGSVNLNGTVNLRNWTDSTFSHFTALTVHGVCIILLIYPAYM